MDIISHLTNSSILLLSYVLVILGGQSDLVTAQDTPYIILGNRVAIHQMRLDGSNRIQLYNANSRPSDIRGLDFDFSRGMMYWSDVANEVIMQSRLDGRDVRTLVSTGLIEPENVAWDWISQKLYWTDIDNDTIKVYDPERDIQKTLLNTGVGSQPRAIVVDPSTRYLYWTDWSDSNPRIVKTSMDGTNSIILANQTWVTWPNALTIDYTNQVLYWADAQRDLIGRVGTNGSDIRIIANLMDILHTTSNHPWAMSYYDGHIYWSDWLNGRAVQRMDVRAGRNRSIVTIARGIGGNNDHPTGIHVVDASRQSSLPNPCSDNNGCCSHFCLLSPTESSGLTCAFPDGFHPNETGRYCVCRELLGNISFSDDLNIGGVASYQCDNGLQQIQCGTSGWSGALCVPPDQAHNLTVESTAPTSISISWKPPIATSLRVLYYLINADNSVIQNSIDDDIIRVNTTTNVTFYNMTGLLPGTTYELTVVAVYIDGGASVAMSQASSPVTATTGFTVPALSCNVPVSSNGVITVTWSYIHTGGLPLSNVSVTYASNEDSESVTINHVPISGIDTTSIEVSNLVTGFEYTFNITADNHIGSTSILCGPTLHRVGRPATPIFGELISGPSAGEVTIMIKTMASGLDDPSQVFWFVITPYTDSTKGETIPHLIPNYQSGTCAMIIVSGLEQGESYRFNATATNTFGVSEVAISNFITAGVGLSVDIGSIVGGVVGGLSALLILTLLAILLIFMVLTGLRKRGNMVLTRSTDETEPEYEVPDFPQQIPKKDLDIELTECPAYGNILAA